MATLRWSFALVLLAVWPAWSQEVVSGPEKGKAVPPLKVFAATGPHQDKDVDYAKERGAKATVFIFIPADKWSRPLARFLKKLDEAVPKVGEDAAVVAVWLTDDPAKAKAYLPVAQNSLQLQVTALTCFTGDKEGPKGWGINADAHATAVVTAKGKVAAVFGYRSVNETAVPAVRDALHKARGGKGSGR
jgi:hypothetical protein